MCCVPFKAPAEWLILPIQRKISPSMASAQRERDEFSLRCTHNGANAFFTKQRENTKSTWACTFTISPQHTASWSRMEIDLHSSGTVDQDGVGVVFWFSLWYCSFDNQTWSNQIKSPFTFTLSYNLTLALLGNKKKECNSMSLVGGS